MADPDLELRGGGGAVLIFLSYWPLSLQSFLLFLPLDPPLVTIGLLHDPVKVVLEEVGILFFFSEVCFEFFTFSYHGMTMDLAYTDFKESSVVLSQVLCIQ